MEVKNKTKERIIIMQTKVPLQTYLIALSICKTTNITLQEYLKNLIQRDVAEKLEKGISLCQN